MIRTKFKRVIPVIMIASMLGISGCGKLDTATELEVIKNESMRKYDLTIKLNSNGSDRYIRLNGYEMDDPEIGEDTRIHTDILTKNSADADYDYLTTIEDFKNDKYINVRALLDKLGSIEELADYQNIFSDLDKDYVVYNDEYLKNTFETYLDNNPNLSNASKPRVITEKETAYGVKDDASLRTQSKMIDNTNELSKLSDMTSFVNTDTKADMVKSFNNLYNMTSSYGSTSYRFGTYITTLKGDEAISYVKDLNNLASDGSLVQNIFGSFFETDFGAYLLEKSADKVNKGFNKYFTDLLNEATEDAVVEFRTADAGFFKKEQGVYAKISTDGTNGIEILYHGGQEISEEDMNKYFKIPNNTMTSTDFFKGVAIKYLDN